MFGFNSHPLHARHARAAILFTRWTTREKKHKLPHFQLRKTRLLSHPREPNGVQRIVNDIRFGQGTFLSSCRGGLSPAGLFPDGETNSVSSTRWSSLSWALNREHSCAASSCEFEKGIRTAAAVLPWTGLESQRTTREIPTERRHSSVV